MSDQNQTLYSHVDEPIDEDGGESGCTDATGSDYSISEDSNHELECEPMEEDEN